MAVSYVGAGTASSGSGGATPTPGIPSGCTDGDVLLCHVYTREAVDGSVTISSGWNQLYQNRTTGGILALFGRRYASGDTAPTLTLINHTSGASGDSVCTQITAWRGVDLANPIAQLGTAYSSTSTTSIGPITGITTGAAGAAVLVMGGKSGADTFTTLTGDSLTWVEAIDTNTTTGLDASLVVNYALTPTAATTITNKTIGASVGSSLARGIMIELKPSVDGGGSQTGWTTFTASGDTRKVYVSSSLGNDANDGLTEATPKLTIAAGVALMRDGYPDWLLFRCGDTFTSAIGQWLISGRSATERMLIGSYGIGARPLFQTGTSTFLYTASGGGSPASVNYLAVTDIEATAEGYTGNAGGDIHGVSFSIASNSILIEGCRFTNFTTGITFTSGAHTAFRVRRNDCSLNFGTTGSVGHGIYLANAQGSWLCEENIADSNSVSPNETEMRHGFYMPEGSNGTNGTLQKNISSRNSSHGFNLRCGGTVQNNLSLNNAIAFYMAGMNGAGTATYAPDFQWNVALDGANIEAAGRGHALTVEKWVGGKCKYNIFAHQTTGTSPVCWSMAAQTFSGVAIANNHFYKWEGGSTWQATAAQLAGTTMSGCSWDLFTYTDFAWDWGFGAARETAAQTVVQSGQRVRRVGGNSTPIYCNGSRTVAAYGTLVGDATISSAANSFPDPERTITTYVQNELGIVGGGIADFVAGARANRRYSWDSRYTASAVNDYIREGFGVSGPPSSSRLLSSPSVMVAAVKAAAIHRN